MPGFKLMRHSKFRHVFGKPFRKEKCYDGINISRNAHENNFCAVNPLFVAIVLEAAGGGTFVVLPLEAFGRIPPNCSKVCGHSGNVMDIKWDPFDDHVIASAAEDGKVRIWQIPPGGLTESIEDPIVLLNGHTRRCSSIEWHPTAKNIIASSGFDRLVLIWNVNTAEIAVKIDCHREIIFSISFNWDGSRIATTSKDKTVRIIDPRTGEVTQQGQSHEGFKSSKCLFAGDTGKLVTVGFDRFSSREIFLWDQDNLTKPLATMTLSSGTGVLFPYYDPDCNVLYIAGKGDSSIIYYEVIPEKPHLFFLNQFQSCGPQRGFGFMPKRGVDMKTNEVVRFYKLHASKNLCEPISMIVPRKGDAFQSDLYPDTASNIPALTAEQWFSGMDAPPNIMSLGGVARPISSFPPAPTPAKVPLKESNIKNTENIPKSTTSGLASSSITMSLASTSSTTMFGNKPTAIVTGINKSEQDVQPMSISLTEKENVSIIREDSETNSIKEKSEREPTEKDIPMESAGEPQKREPSPARMSSPARQSLFAQWKSRDAESRSSGTSSPSGSISRGESRKFRDFSHHEQLSTGSRSSSGEIEIVPQETSQVESSPSRKNFRSPLSSTTSNDEFEVRRSLNEEGREVIRINMSPTKQTSGSSSASSSPRRGPSVSDSSTRRQFTISTTEPSRAPSLGDTNRRSVSVSDDRPYTSSFASSIANRFSLGSNGAERRNLDDEPLLTSKDMGMDQLRKAYLRQQEDIKQLKSKILLKDQRIRQLERELELATNESSA